MWADAKRDGRPAEYRWRPLQKFRNSIPCRLVPRRKVWLTPAAGVPCSNAANIGDIQSATAENRRGKKEKEKDRKNHRGRIG